MTDAKGFGFEILVTYLLPGIGGLGAFLIGHGVDFAQMEAMLTWAKDAQFLSTFLILAGVTLMGAIVATLQAVLETYLLDQLTSRLIGIPKQQFDNEWIDYVRLLPTSKNSYIARVVMFFQFETRMGLSTLILAGFLFTLSSSHGWAALIAGVFLYAIGVLHHLELATYRHRCFGAGPIGPAVPDGPKV